jgi:hypothetical protein
VTLKLDPGEIALLGETSPPVIVGTSHFNSAAVLKISEDKMKHIVFFSLIIEV